MCIVLHGFRLHAATHARGLDEQGREALLERILRPGPLCFFIDDEALGEAPVVNPQESHR
jgi:hypothetical protein